MNNYIHYPSPNFDYRPEGAKIDTVIIHYTAVSKEEALHILTSPEWQVSSHYLIDETGELYLLVPEEYRAWHAGVSHWAGRDNMNHYSIGIELVNDGANEFSTEQIRVLKELLDEVSARYEIEDYLGHSDVAPGRKIDPGRLFPWEKLAQYGYGKYPQVEKPALNYIIEEGEGLLACQQKLFQLGYKIELSGKYDATSSDVINAFKMHYNPSDYSDEWDIYNDMILDSLLCLTV